MVHKLNRQLSVGAGIWLRTNEKSDQNWKIFQTQTIHTSENLKRIEEQVGKRIQARTHNNRFYRFEGHFQSTWACFSDRCKQFMLQIGSILTILKGGKYYEHEATAHRSKSPAVISDLKWHFRSVNLECDIFIGSTLLEMLLTTQNSLAVWFTTNCGPSALTKCELVKYL